MQDTISKAGDRQFPNARLKVEARSIMLHPCSTLTEVVLLQRDCTALLSHTLVHTYQYCTRWVVFAALFCFHLFFDFPLETSPSNPRQ